MVVVKRVVDHLAVPPALDQAQFAQHFQMLGHSRLADAYYGGQVTSAKLLAEKRARWNFKTAVPIYNPRFNKMSLLLPLALLNDEVVDISLVVTKNASGSYQGRTVFPLTWAYRNARLVCRPDSDWLTPEKIVVPERGEEELDEGESDTVESNE